MPAEEVIQSFKKFDQDGNGLISRDEMTYVLKALKSDKFDEASVDQLMAKADTNGDGKLQIEEFVKWLFEAVKETTMANNPELMMMSESAKRKMATEIFEHFDKDKDGFWNFLEASECSRITSDGGVTEEVFGNLVKSLQPGEDSSKGLSKESIVQMYLNPMWGQDVLKDHKYLGSGDK
ncbi:unnamed protein product [Effrenium voratum]|nr:unnamed protein product [Effrenium voratum]CAJ1457834.1 unnamed protein product [Effrenium voratum]|mmetsp:Transcript_12689/g.30203  ORF Transcript_12689/g.30203 Transcript_12689/m.30203 type:complete len:179 (+) Transcript_12689:66-602(+)|eukprot:CAMPEP_0181437490 /NCGR_PEP_ID=MMETSP1110-20121109/21407_1 /TAXON_ID=174948 /ORGANISM="Symbiodinium sp., Strain CCMP421" /LENGTH=178 /DNA_ID=CAMNT_0023561121 /DNA_START=51 /DNA_END=587 /DNA_ORIENTATION=+